MRRRFRPGCAVGFLSFCFLIIGSAQAQVPDFGWVRAAGGVSYDSGTGVAVDAAGNSYVTGQFMETATFGSTSLVSTGNTDIFVAKYDSAGNALWARSAGSPGAGGEDSGSGIAVDHAGNVFVTGYFSAPSAVFGAITLTNAGTKDVFVAKYDTTGNLLWVRSAGGTGQDIGIAVATEGTNCYVTGSFLGTASFGNTNLTSTTSFWDVFVAKYDSDGNLLWAGKAGGAGVDQGQGIAVDAAGNSLVTGYFSPPSAVFGAVTLTNGGSRDVFVARYDSAGAVIWASRAGGAGDDQGFGIARDDSGNCYVTGWFVSPTALFGAIVLTNLGGNDVFVAKLDSLGNVLWAKGAGGPGFDAGATVAVDAAGNSHVAGNFFSPTATFGNVSLTNGGLAGTSDAFFAKYDSSGNLLWAKQAAGNADDSVAGISLDALGNGYVTGAFSSTNAIFDALSLTNSGFSDFFLARIDAERPRLDITLAGNQTLLCWPTYHVGFVLECRASLSASNGWSAVTNVPAIDGQRYWVTNQPGGAGQFYRLRKP